LARGRAGYHRAVNRSILTFDELLETLKLAAAALRDRARA
jgi:hypothetical protein